MFILDDQIHLVLNNHKISIDKVISKGVYEELISQFVTPPMAQLRYNENFNTVCLDWKEIYSLPFKVSLDTKSREFQYKILNRYLATNTYLKRIGKIDSSACSFCGTTDESLEHLLVTCQFTAAMWQDLISCCNNQNIKVETLSNVDIIFGDWQRKEDFELVNHLILIGKQYIYITVGSTTQNRPSEFFW